MDEQTMKDYIEDLLQERADLYAKVNAQDSALHQEVKEWKVYSAEAAERAEHWYAVAEKLWRASLDREPTLQELWAFRDGK